MISDTIGLSAGNSASRLYQEPAPNGAVEILDYVMNYIEDVYQLLDEELQLKSTEYEGLLETYGLLVLTVGEKCTNAHIHDAWSVWQNRTSPNHRSLKPFKDLSKHVQSLDEPYMLAVRRVAKRLRVIKKEKTRTPFHILG